MTGRLDDVEEATHDRADHPQAPGGGCVRETLERLLLQRGIPDHVRCDNGPELVAQALREWLECRDIAPLYIEPGAPWNNGHAKALTGSQPDELLDGDPLLARRDERGHQDVARPAEA